MPDAAIPESGKPRAFLRAVAVAIVAVLAIATVRVVSFSELWTRFGPAPDGGSYIVLEADPAEIDLGGPGTVDKTFEVIRKRIDAAGLREPTITRAGKSRIRVEVLGVYDPAALNSLLGQTAKLEFKLVDVNSLASDAEQGIAPPGDELLPFAAGTAQFGSIAVHRLGGLRGSSIKDARQAFNSASNEPVVDIQFDDEGSARFAKLTTDNVGKPFAIILDDEVLSAPIINEPILAGRAEINGGFSVESAGRLALLLRSGTMPLKLKVIEQGAIGSETPARTAGRK